MRTRTDRYQLADTAVWRVGYGAMQLAGPGVFGPPDDHDEAIADIVLLIPGTSSRSHLAENIAAGSLSLSDDEVASLTATFETACTGGSGKR